MKQVIKDEGSRPIKIWTNDIEPEAIEQLKNLAKMPFIHPHGVVAMADAHAGIGSTVGSVIATEKVVIPASVGVDIGCGMNAVRLSLSASDLPLSLEKIRLDIEKSVPLGAGGAHREESKFYSLASKVCDIDLKADAFRLVAEATYGGDPDKAMQKMASQLGTLGSGNHFIELCLDESDQVWVMLHSGSRGIGNMIGRHYIEQAKKEMEKWHVSLPDINLAYLPEGSQYFNDYMMAVSWAQDYARLNRQIMMDAVLQVLQENIDLSFCVTHEAVNCHHNYVEKENHYGKNVWVTRKGAIRARSGDLGIIPGARGARSYIVRGLGNPESYCSCSHGAGRQMSRTEARKRFTLEDLKAQSEGIECWVDEKLIDEIKGAYKDIDTVMENQRDLVEVLHTLRAVLNVKGA